MGTTHIIQSSLIPTRTQPSTWIGPPTQPTPPSTMMLKKWVILSGQLCQLSTFIIPPTGQWRIMTRLCIHMIKTHFINIQCCMNRTTLLPMTIFTIREDTLKMFLLWRTAINRDLHHPAKPRKQLLVISQF